MNLQTCQKAVKSSLVIIPPESCWPQIQSIREQHDKAFRRWMPHINLLYPFIEEGENRVNFTVAAELIKSHLEHLRPFKVVFNKESFGYFSHKKNCTLWLGPLQQNNEGAAGEEKDGLHPNLLDLQSRLMELFPQCTDLSQISARGFKPHLSLGQFRANDIEHVIQTFKDSWNNIEFNVTDVCLISRENFDDPFHVRYSVRFGGAS